MGQVAGRMRGAEYVLLAGSLLGLLLAHQAGPVAQLEMALGTLAISATSGGLGA